MTRHAPGSLPFTSCGTRRVLVLCAGIPLLIIISQLFGVGQFRSTADRFAPLQSTSSSSSSSSSFSPCHPPVPPHGSAPPRPSPDDDRFPFLVRLSTLCLTAQDGGWVALSPCEHGAAAAAGAAAVASAVANSRSDAHTGADADRGAQGVQEVKDAIMLLFARQQWRYTGTPGHIESVGFPGTCLDAYMYGRAGQVGVQLTSCHLHADKHQQRFFWGGDESVLADMGRRLHVMGLEGEDNERGGEQDCIGAATSRGTVFRALPGEPHPVQLGLFPCGGLAGSYDYETKTAYFFNRDPLVDFSTTVVLAAATPPRIGVSSTVGSSSKAGGGKEGGGNRGGSPRAAAAAFAGKLVFLVSQIANVLKVMPGVDLVIVNPGTAEEYKVRVCCVVNVVCGTCSVSMWCAVCVVVMCGVHVVFQPCALTPHIVSYLQANDRINAAAPCALLPACQVGSREFQAEAVHMHARMHQRGSFGE